MKPNHVENALTSIDVHEMRLDLVCHMKADPYIDDSVEQRMLRELIRYKVAESQERAAKFCLHEI